MRSSLARLTGKPRTDPAVIESMRRKAWQEQGIITIRPDDILDAWLRVGVKNWATAKWGKRV